MSLSSAITGISVATFAASSYVLFFSSKYRFKKEENMFDVSNQGYMNVLLHDIQPVQLAAMVGIAISFISLLSFSGVSFVLSLSQGASTESTSINSKASNEKSKSKRNTQLAFHEMVCVGIVIAELLVILYSLITRSQEFITQKEWPSPVGLIWGITWAGIAQVIVVSYYCLLRFFVKSENETIQNRSVDYPEGGIISELITHASQPEAFFFLILYLSLTWYFRLLPDSYIDDYNTSTEWYKVFLQLLVVDIFTFANHVVEHRIPPIYIASHKSHHRFINPRFLIAFNGSLADTFILILLPLYATGSICTNITTWSYIAFGAVYSGYFMLIHCEWSHPFDHIFSKIGFYTSIDHHVHHAGFNYNYAHFFTYWDRLAGTYREGSSMKVFRSYDMKTDAKQPQVFEDIGDEKNS